MVASCEKYDGLITSGEHESEVKPTPLLLWLFACLVAGSYTHMIDAQNKVIAPSTLAVNFAARSSSCRATRDGILLSRGPGQPRAILYFTSTKQTINCTVEVYEHELQRRFSNMLQKLLAR